MLLRSLRGPLTPARLPVSRETDFEVLSSYGQVWYVYFGCARVTATPPVVGAFRRQVL
jgi:hypothetical protein